MADTTVKVDSAVRDRLAVIAAQRGVTIRDLVAELATATPTQEELDARHAAATAYLREQLCPDLNDDDAVAGERYRCAARHKRRPSYRGLAHRADLCSPPNPGPPPTGASRSSL
ncbi:MAG: hypothetical protein ACRDRW_20915 [Pseudonocardiaceae bacterium]